MQFFKVSILSFVFGLFAMIQTGFAQAPKSDINEFVKAAGEAKERIGLLLPAVQKCAKQPLCQQYFSLHKTSPQK